MFRRAKQSALEQGLERAKQAQEAVAQRRWSEGFEHAALAAQLLMAAMKDPANKTRVPQLRQSVNQMLQLAEDAKKGEAEAAAAEEARRAADGESAQAMHLLVAHSPHARLAARATDEEEAVQQGAVSDHERRHDRSVAYARQSDGHPEVALYTTGRDRPTNVILEDCEPTHSLSLRGSASACQCYGVCWRFHFRACSCLLRVLF